MFLMTLTIMMLLSASIITIKHPLAMGSVLLIQTIMMTFNTGFMFKTFWYSYIAFLIMIGGMLILFIYMTSIASNEKFLFSIKSTVMLIIIFMLLMLMYLTMEIYSFSMVWSLPDMVLSNKTYNQNTILSKYYTLPMLKTSITMMIYLLFTLTAIVKITNIKSGALRQKN